MLQFYRSLNNLDKTRIRFVKMKETLIESQKHMNVLLKYNERIIEI